MKKPVDFDWYCKTKKDVINNAAYELIVALTAKSAPPRKFELSIPQRDLGNRCDNPHCIFKDASGRPKVQPSEREEDPEEGGDDDG